MNQLVFLDGQVQERLVRAMQSAVHVRRRHQLFLWAQGQFFVLMPHEILICLRLQRGNGATHVECVHNMIFDQKQEDMLCHQHEGLAVRLALSCEESGCLPSLVAAGAADHAQIYEQFRDDLNKAGLRNAIVHGDRVSAHSDASFFIIFNVDEEVTPMHGHLMQLLLPYLHLAFNHVVSQDGCSDSVSEAIEVVLPTSITGRELQVLQWICSGKSNYEIGVILNVSPLTVKNHVQKIFRKFNVHNRAQAVSRAMSLNLFREPG
jgi:transcriptional regulator EpsA